MREGELLGQGATTHTRLLRDGVEKRLVPRFRGDASARAALLAEARILEALDGRGAPRLVRTGEDEHGPWLLMEYVPLPPVAALTGERRAERASRLVGPAFHALSLVHEAADAAGPLFVVHGDVSPENLLASTGSGSARLVDFGLATYRDTPAVATGALRGTPRYVAPEVARGEAATARSDLFSLGLTLLYVASGEAPRPAENLAAVVLSAAEDPVTAYAERAAEGLAVHVRDALLAVVAFDPAARPASAREAWRGGSW